MLGDWRASSQPAGLGSIPNILPEQRSVFLQVALFAHSGQMLPPAALSRFAIRTSYCLFRKHALISSSELFTILNYHFVNLFIWRGLCCTRTPDSGEIRQAKLAGRALLSQLPD